MGGMVFWGLVGGWGGEYSDASIGVANIFS